MKASQLRDLTRRYAAGGIGREDYVAERTRLIDGIVAGDIEIRYRDLLPPAPKPRARASRHGLLLLGSAALVGLLSVALLAHFFGPPPMTATPADTRARAPATVLPSNPGEERLQAFMAADDWSAPSLQRLEADWHRLTPFQQEGARRSTAFRRLKHETNRRISEQEALLAAGEMDALLHAGRLREFADRLGLQLER